MNRTGGGGPNTADPIAAVLGDPAKRKLAGQIIGQSLVRAYNTIQQNKPAIEHIADTLLASRELYGDEVVRVLEEANLKPATYDLLDEKSWPTI
jgi:hypothetical protein